jgi:hypothetical protein
MWRHGYHLTAEVLATGMVSCTIEGDDEDVDIEVVSNGPEVQDALARMLARRKWLLK